MTHLKKRSWRYISMKRIKIFVSSQKILNWHMKSSQKRKKSLRLCSFIFTTQNTLVTVNEESFFKTFKSMPWLALPFKDPTYRKLKRLFGHNPDEVELVQTPSLVIIGPHGEFVEPWGDDILMRYKLQAYPFTREAVAKLETEKIKELKLEMLWDRNALFRRNNGTDVSSFDISVQFSSFLVYILNDQISFFFEYLIVKK